jgi:hypothetical protein
MKEDYTDISIVLDRSGSMQLVKDDTIGGFNQFLQDQKNAPGLATISLHQFDDRYETVYAAIIISDAQPLTDQTFIPRGSTALLDAIGRTINETGKRLGTMDESDRPAKIVFVILTDGHENASREFTLGQIHQMIQHQRENYKWEFVFLGANQDAISTAGQMGISMANALSYAANSAGTKAAFGATSRNLVSYRAGAKVSMDFADIDRDEQKKAGVKSR